MKLTSIKNMRRKEPFKVWFNQGKNFWIGLRLNSLAAKDIIKRLPEPRIAVVCVKSKDIYFLPTDTQVERMKSWKRKGT